MQNNNSGMYYVPSGKAPASGILTSIIGGAAAAIILAIVYIALQWFIPFIYLNLFICLGFGFGLAFALSFLFKQGKIRNKKIALLISFVIALIGLYAQWALYVSLMLDAEGSGGFFVRSSFNLDTFFTTLMHPKEMFGIIQVLNDIGTITIKSSTISGAFLWVIWAIEAGIIIIFPLVSGAGRASEPFSETNNAWMDEVKNDKRHLFVDDGPALKLALESRNYESINLLKSEEVPLDRYSLITTYTSAGDNEGYLSIENVTVTINNKNEEKKAKQPVISYLSAPLSFINKL